MLHAVVMAGGSGTRFWPLSRDAMPKQLVRIGGGETMLRRTAQLFVPHIPAERIMVVCGAVHEAETRRQLSEFHGVRIILEPEGRDTAACIGLAAVMLMRDDPGAVMAVTPADHFIRPAERFHAALAQAEEIVRRDHVLVTFGVKPRAPETGFGYIERGEALAGPAAAFGAYRAASFREKPDRAAALELVRAGRFYWNSGTFVWRASDIMDALKKFTPALHYGLLRIGEALGTPTAEAVIAREYAGLDRISIDYGVMEKADNAVVLAVDYDWDDLGSWGSLARLHGADAQGNTLIGRTCLLDSAGCIVVTDEGHLIGVVGAGDLVIVHSGDATLVCPRERLGEVKDLVKRLRENGLADFV